MKIASRQAWLAVASVALCAALAPPLLGALAPAARAAAGHGSGAVTSARAPAATSARARTAALEKRAAHVVIVGISGLRWEQVTPAATPALWRLADGGSVGSLVDYAQQPLACPADGWLTLNAAARAAGPRPCTGLPAVIQAGAGARVPSMPRLIRANAGFREAPDWGLLGSLASCATAVGPGAALALASPAGMVSSYLPSAARLSAGVLARCPLTVIDLGQITAPERARVSTIDRQLARIAAELPSDTRLLVTAPGAAAAGTATGAPAGLPHLMTIVVSGPGYRDGLLTASSTRRPGIVTLTDLTPTVAGWLGAAVPAGTVGARIGRSGRAGLDATVRALIGRDTAERVWLTTHGWFFAGYAAADAVAFGVPALLYLGSGPERRRRRARSWRAAGTLAVAVPLGSYLANLAPWWELAHPAWWLYGLAAAGTAAVAAAALAGPWRRDPLGPFCVLALATLALLAGDVMTGSRLQLDAPFGLSLLVSGRFYGIGNDALGVYCVSALVAAACAAHLVAARAPGSPGGPGSPGAPGGPGWTAAAGAGVVGLVAVIASGWPGFGAKVGGTIALVPCLLLLLARLAGVRVGWRWAVPIALSGIALFAVFAVISYLFPAAGVSDMGAFAGNLLHGRGGDLLRRKASSNVGTLAGSMLGWLIPVMAVLAAAALWRPAALRLRTLARAFASAPLLHAVLWLCWLVLVIGWFADDSGVIVPAAALPFVVPLAIAMTASVSTAAGGARYFGTAFAGTSAAGQPLRQHRPLR